MISDYQHRVLVVDDDALVGKAIGRLLEIKKIKPVYADSGESALEHLKTADQPFSLIISDQRMPGMQGTQFLEHAKRLHPETIRFLITGHSEMQTIINAVNKGAVQRYISKPWANDEMVQSIEYGIGQYERFLEEKALITLAKKQNARLYELNCELMETAKAHTKELRVIDTEIEAIETQLKKLPPPSTVSPARIMAELQQIVSPLGEKGQETLNNLFAQTIAALYKNFSDLSLANGFEMPPLGKKGGPMTDPAKPKILILESDETISDHARAVLTREGWDVSCESVSKTALQRLETAKSSPFNLFISNFKLPKMQGDDIHKNAKVISPMTQRMLMVPADELDMVIRAINKGGINSCIVYPFQDEDLINQAKYCLAQFQRSMKRRQLKRVTQHQNKQLFQIAQKMKKKSEACQKLIGEKKASVLMHRSKLRKALKQKTPHQNATLDDRLSQNSIPVVPESLASDFFMLCDYIKALFDSTASKTDLNPVVLDLHPLVSTQDQMPLPENDTNAAVTAGTADAVAETVPSDFVQKILKLAFTSKPDPGIDDSLEKTGTKNENEAASLTAYFEIQISMDKTAASIQKTKGMGLPDIITLSGFLNYLRDQKIIFGIIEDEAIEAWISDLEAGEHPLLVARGEACVPSEDGHIKFHFEQDFTNPGKLQSDGTIDFRDRGAVPYVHKGDLLAKKTPAKEGKKGIDVFGDPILVEEALDPLFIAGSGTEIKEDEQCIYAALDGQPHVDAVGNITVNPELMIKGDVDFATGNIDFNGNIIVNGVIKEGFMVKGISLTAQEIEGATIELSGDLHISDGITEATITSVGNVHAKFINHSIVAGFGDLNIQREIIDSTVTISGTCHNAAGHIIASKIIAKQGIEAGKIGTSSSKPALLRIGVDDHIQQRIQTVGGQLEKSLAHLQELKKKIKLIETQDQELYEQITQRAQIQESAQNETKKIEQAIPFLTKGKDAAGLQKATLQIKKLSETAAAAEQELNQIFETQDRYARQVEQLKEQMNHIERQNKTYVLEKKGFKAFADKTPPLPRLHVKGTITQDTTIQGPNSSITLREDLSRCQIQEKSIMEEGQCFYEMTVSNL